MLHEKPEAALHGVTVEQWTTWADRYIGTAEELVPGAQ